MLAICYWPNGHTFHYLKLSFLLIHFQIYGYYCNILKPSKPISWFSVTYLETSDINEIVENWLDTNANIEWLQTLLVHLHFSREDQFATYFFHHPGAR
ncbi:hypothetical protein BLOT_006916 [Blomia tropicalis]|nr:hypothetical protein BLOT_006916 [Blomia tropicalis]